VRLFEFNVALAQMFEAYFCSLKKRSRCKEVMGMLLKQEALYTFVVFIHEDKERCFVKTLGFQKANRLKRRNQLSS